MHDGLMGLFLYAEKGRCEAGVDEAGRGCLAGPVTAAAVIPGPAGQRWVECGLNDSKTLTSSSRTRLRSMIEEEALAWSVGWASEREIEALNILHATHLAMHRAVDGLKLRPAFLLIDGNRFREHEIPHSCEVKGDGRFLSIAAASVLAKTHRDAHMLELSRQHPRYGWSKNKGYPTRAHREAIANYGTTAFHRRTFRGAQGLLFED